MAIISFIDFDLRTHTKIKSNKNKMETTEEKNV